MAKRRHSRQSWWQVAVLILIMIGLLFLAHQVAPSPGWRTFLDLGVVVVSYGLTLFWTKSHSPEFLDQRSVGVDSLGIEPTEGEMPALTTPPIQFHMGSDPAITGGTASPPNNLPANGHHPARTIPSLPEDVSNN